MGGGTERIIIVSSRLTPGIYYMHLFVGRLLGLLGYKITGLRGCFAIWSVSILFSYFISLAHSGFIKRLVQ